MKGPRDRHDGRRTAVAYVRVSTKEQGVSGLGIEAQRSAIRDYCRANGYELLHEYQDVESGRHNERPGLKDAISHASGSRSLLLIAKLDRLSRSLKFIVNLLDGDVSFVCCDVPSADREHLQFLGIIAEREARTASDRTKAAMKAAKERGAVFGTPANLTPEACRRGAIASRAARRQKRDVTASAVAERIRELRALDHSYKLIARVLNEAGMVTSRAHRWSGKAVWRVALLRRLNPA
jgi:DNA invertase Pin-like site-specific DNA recombinase